MKTLKGDVTDLRDQCRRSVETFSNVGDRARNAYEFIAESLDLILTKHQSAHAEVVEQVAALTPDSIKVLCREILRREHGGSGSGQQTQSNCERAFCDMLFDALDKVPTEPAAVTQPAGVMALIAELADTELAGLACIGSNAPVEDILGRLFKYAKDHKAAAVDRNEVFTTINHERDPHCCGCWNIGHEHAVCNECGEKRALCDLLATPPIELAVERKVPDGWKLVPIDGDYKMISAACTSINKSNIPLGMLTVGEVWRAIKAAIEASPAPPAEPAAGGLSDAAIKAAVNRFLGWKFPKHFCPDGGISFKPSNGIPYEGDALGNSWWPIGTNLLSAEQAEQMVRYILAGAPIGWLPIESAPKDGTVVFLLLEDADSPLENESQPRTIGCYGVNGGAESDPTWTFAGWDWDQDEYVRGDGTPTHWMPLPAPPSNEPVRGVVK